MTKKIFVTGTGTDVGKTFVTALLIKKLNELGKSCAYYKAAMSGNIRENNGRLIPGDAAYVKSISGINQPIEEMCPYIYEHAFSPHLAAKIEGNPIEFNIVQRGFDIVCKKYNYVTMEGSGGIICPIRRGEKIINLEDIIKKLQLSCILVAKAGLGSINSVVLSISYMRQKGIPIKGIILNCFHPGNIMEEDNLYQCEEMTGVKVIATVKENDTDLFINSSILESIYE